MSDDDLNIPPRLADDLADVTDARIFVPPDRDDAILAEARMRLKRTAERNADETYRIPVWPAKVAGVAVIAFLTVTLLVVGPLAQKNESPTAPHLADSAADSHTPLEDIDASGTVDIIDALHLARVIETDDAPSLWYDYNADDKVDERDVEHLARRAVALHTPGGAG